MAKAYVNKRDKFLWDNSFKPEDKIPTPSASDEGKAIVVDDDGNYALDEVSAETIYFDLRLNTSDSTITVTDTEHTVAEINELARSYANVSLRVQYDEDDIHRLFRLYRVEDWVTKWNDTVSSAEDGVININTDSINMQDNGTIRFYRRTLSNTPYNYSTEEHIVGTWIDGKPVYEKTVIANKSDLAADVASYYSHGISDIDSVIGYEVYFRFTNGAISDINYVPEYYTQEARLSASWCCSINYVSKTQISYMMGSNVYASDIDKMIATIRYTKTTD